MSITQLQAVNIMLRAIHLRPGQTENESDSGYALAISTLTQERRFQLANGFKFNTDTITLTYNSERALIPVPAAYLTIKNLPDGLVIRDGGVWDTANNEYYSETLVNMEVVIDMEVTQMPEPFAQWIAHAAAARYYEDALGEPSAWLEKRANKALANALRSERYSIKSAAGITKATSAHSGGLG